MSFKHRPKFAKKELAMVFSFNLEVQFRTVNFSWQCVKNVVVFFEGDFDNFVSEGILLKLRRCNSFPDFNM